MITAKQRKDLRMLVKFVEVYCHDHHGDVPEPVAVRVGAVDVTDVAEHPIRLCEDCRRLLMHAAVKRLHCEFGDEKPACKHCPRHCYAPNYRQQMRQVMRHSGKALVLRGRVDLLLHLLF